MLICRDVATSFSSCAGIRINSSASRGMVESGGTAAMVYCKAKPSARGCLLRREGERSLDKDAVRNSNKFWGVRLDLGSCEGMVASRRRRSLGLMVVRAQQSRFFKKYARSPQDKIEMLVKTLCTSKESAAEILAQHGTWMKPPDWFNVLDGIGRRRRWLLALEVGFQVDPEPKVVQGG